MTIGNNYSQNRFQQFNPPLSRNGNAFSQPLNAFDTNASPFGTIGQDFFQQTGNPSYNSSPYSSSNDAQPAQNPGILEQCSLALEQLRGSFTQLLSGLGVAYPELQQTQNRGASRTTVILDNGTTPIAENPDTGETVTHGELVEAAFHNALEENGIEGIESEFVQINDAEPEHVENAAEYVDFLLNEPVQSRTEAIRSLVDRGDVGVVNISSGTSVAKVARQISSQIDRQAETGNYGLEEEFQELLQVTGDRNSREFQQALFDYIQSRTASGGFQQTMADYNNVVNYANASDVALVVTAGNEQAQIDALNTQGLSIDDESGLNFLANNPDVFVAGATDDQGTSTYEDDEAAVYSSRGGTIDFAANGTNAVTVNGITQSGTSFTAPEGAAAITVLKQLHPDWSNERIHQELQSGTLTVDNPNIDAEVEGAGTLNWQAVLAS
ncbi:MAG: S8 family serine peptidase [Vampirovibrionales bacterium]|nr:S8 family serine peptidase [Vampirovibrionales bacterium]